jgi:hypothetical protein
MEGKEAFLLLALLGLGVVAVSKQEGLPPLGGQIPPNTGIGNGFTPVKGTHGSLDESYLDTTDSRANLTTRYNNPMAIKYRSYNNWNGKIPLQPGESRTFEKFFSYPQGVRAGIYLLRYRYLADGYNTVDSIIKRYAPTSDNTIQQQENYINYVAGRLGVGKHTVLNNDKATIKKLVQAMARFEGGQTNFSSPELVTNTQFETAWSIL